MLWISRAAWIAYCVALSAIVAAAAGSNRAPLPLPALAVGFAGAHFLAGLVIARWRALALCVLLAPGAVVVGRETGNWIQGFTVAFAIPIAMAFIGAGVVAARLLPRRPDGAARPPGWALAPVFIVAFGALPF